MKSQCSLFLIMIMLIVTPLKSAELVETGIDSTTIDNCSLKLSGEIQKGDAARIEVILEGWNKREPGATHASKFNGLDYVVCLSGFGGDYLEAIKIAEVFVLKAVATSVPENASCLSACAIAFMGGRDCCVELGRTINKRHLSSNSRLGLAAPTLRTDKTSFTSQEISAAFNQSLDVITELQNKAENLHINSDIINHLIASRNGDYFEIKPDPGHKNNFLDEEGKVFQDIWIPGISGTVNQGTADQNN